MAQSATSTTSNGAGQAPAASATATATLRGKIADPTGALIPGTLVTVANAKGKVVGTATGDASGGYELRGLAPGTYTVQATYSGFAPFVSAPIVFAPGASKRVDITMAIQVQQQVITVSDEAPTVSVDAGSNASAIVLKGKDLDALSDDPDELSSELTALAGPSAGPNGGQIYIDGFTGGQLPPKSAIREIRINQNPFSAEFDRLGYGRIEILTKPGTDKLHGQFFAQGNDDAFNTGNPYTQNIPPYYSYQFNGTLNGSLSKWASFFISAERRNNQTAQIYDVTNVVADSSGVYGPVVVNGSLVNPRTRTNISPRVDLQLGAKNTLTLRYQYYRDTNVDNTGSSIQLPSQAESTDSSEQQAQATDTIVVNDHVVNETRFQYLRDLSTTTPNSAAPQISIPGTLAAGGSTGQTSTDHQDHLELQNITTMTLGTQTVKFGTRVRDNRDANSTNGNFNGSFTFSSVAAYTDLLNDLRNPGMTQAQILAGIASSPACTNPSSTSTPCALPSKFSYNTGPLAAVANVFDGALFVQDDWKTNRNLTLSAGLRWETQNHISDHSDWAPRASFAYALDGHKQGAQSKTVLRGGFGIFYDRLGLGNVLAATRQSGNPATSQSNINITNATCFSSTSLAGIDLSTCGPAASSESTLIKIAPHFHAEYTQQFGMSLERQLSRTTTFTTNFVHSYGVHQVATIDANAYLPGTFQFGSATLTGVRPDPSLGIVEEYYPEAVFKQNQLTANVNARFSPTFSMIGFYNLTWANTNNGTASNSYNLSQDYGRAGFAARNSVFMLANYTAPYAIRFSPFLIANSSHPFNIVTANDLTGDNFYNDRPGIADAGLCATGSTRYYSTPYGCLDTIPTASEKLLPINKANGPAGVAVNLRISRTWGIGPKIANTTGPNGGQNQPGGPPPGGPGGGRGGPGGGGGRGGPGGGPFSFAANTNRKYNLSFSIQALNLFNDIVPATPDGTVGSPLFDQSTSLAGGIFSSGAAARRITLQTIFSF